MASIASMASMASLGFSFYLPSNRSFFPKIVPNREKTPGWDFFYLNFATENKPEVATFHSR